MLVPNTNNKSYHPCNQGFGISAPLHMHIERRQGHGQHTLLVAPHGLEAGGVEGGAL